MKIRVIFKDSAFVDFHDVNSWSFTDNHLWLQTDLQRDAVVNADSYEYFLVMEDDE